MKPELIGGRPMTPRERVLAAGGHYRPDRCPMDFGGTAMSLCKAEFLAKLRAELGYRLPADRDADGEWVDESIQRYLGVDMRWVPFAPPLAVLRELDPAAYQTAKAAHERQKIAAAAATVKTTAVKHDHPLAALSLDDIRKLPVTRREPLAYADWTIQTARQFRADGFATTYWVSGGFFEQGCAGRGYDQFAMNLADDPDLVRALFDNWLLNKLSQVEMVVKPLAPYIDWFCFGDDLGLQTGPFMSPAMFRDLIKPYLAEYYRQVHAAAPDALIFHHSCGSVYRLLDDLIDIGVNVLNPIQPNAFEMEPERLKEKARGRLCLHGGIDLQHLLPFGSPQEVRDETARRMRILGEDGGYVCAPAHSLPEDVPTENILAMFGK